MNHALPLDDQHMLNTQNIENNATIEHSESSSSFRSSDSDSNSVLEQLLCFSPATSVQNSDSDPEYLPSKKTCKSVPVAADHSKSTCRRSARLSTFKDATANLLSLPLATSEDPEYLPPKGILYALQKSVSDSVPKSDIITNVKQRKLRRSKKLVDPACNGCNSTSHETFLISCNNVRSVSNLSMSSSPLSTEQLRQILEDSTFEEVSKENTSKKETRAEVDREVQSGEVVNHDSRVTEDTAKDTTVKMPRTRSSLKLKVKKKDKEVNFSISATAKSDSDNCSPYKVSKDEVLPKIHIHKESKKVLKKRKRQTCRKQFRHKDITLYKLGADPDPVNEATQKNHVIHKIFLRRSSVSTPPSTPQTSKVNKNEEVSEDVLSNTNTNGDNKCPENITVKENNSFKINNSNCDLSNSDKIYCSSISIENHNMSKVPKVILTPINTKDIYHQKSAVLKDKMEVIPQTKHEKTRDINSNFKKDLAGQDKLSRNEVGKHNLPIRIPERRTSIAEPLRTPPAPNNKVPSFHTEFQSENQFAYMKIEIKNNLSENREVIYVKPVISQVKVVNLTKPTMNSTELSTTSSVAPSIVSQPLRNESMQVNKENLNTKENGSLPAINDADNIVTREVANSLSNMKPAHNRDSIQQAETHRNLSQETREADGPQNLSIKVVKSCSGITDPLKLHKTATSQSKKIDSDVKCKVNSVTLPKENHGMAHRRTDDPNSSIADKSPPINSNETPHKSSSILQQNLLNGPIFKSDIYRNAFHNRGNISLNNFNSELSAYALNSLAMNHLRTPYSNTVCNLSRNMPIIEETNQKVSNDKVTYEPFGSTSPFATDSSKRNKKGKRKLSRSDLYEEIAPKLQRCNNYPYPSYNYPLSFYSGAPPNSPYNPLSPFPLGIPHSVYNMVAPVYQPKPSNCTGQSSTFDRTGFRNIAPPIINPYLSHDSRLPVSSYSSPNPPVSSYSSSNSPVSKPYDPHMPYNHFLRVSNPMFMNHNTLPPDYGSVGINNRRNEASPQNTNPSLQQGFNVPSKNCLRNATRQSPHQMFPPSENTHRRSADATEPQSTPLALIKSTTPTQCNNWSNIPIASRNEELTITKLPLRDSLPKPAHILPLGQTCTPGHQVEDLTVHSKQSDFRKNDGKTCSIVALSKSNIKNTDSSTNPCSKLNASERHSGVGSVLHGDLANVSISIIKNKNEKHNKPTPLSQQGLLPILERAKFLQDKQRISIPQTTKGCEANHSNSHTTPVQNVQSSTTLSIQKNGPKVYVAASETNKNVSAEEVERHNSGNSKTTSPANIYRDIELEINCTKITKPIKNISNNNDNNSYSGRSPINSKTSLPNTRGSVYKDPEPKLENKIGVTTLNRKVEQNTSPLSNLESNTVANTERKPKSERNSMLSDTECGKASPNTINKTAEAVNLSIDKPSEIASATIVGRNENIAASETVTRATTNTPKSSNINTIASIMQDIMRHGDVKKFDRYVEALRRSLEHREIPKLDAAKQTCSENLLAKIVKAREKYAGCNSHHATVPGNIITSPNSSKPPNNMISKPLATTNPTRAHIFNPLSSENVAKSKPVTDLTNTVIPHSSPESEPTNSQVSPSENVASKRNGDTRDAADYHNPKPYQHIDKQVSQTEVMPEHLNAQILSSSGSQCKVDSETIAASKNTLIPQCAVASEDRNLPNKSSAESENVVTSENIENPIIQIAVACESINTQATPPVAISENTTTETDKDTTNTEDSRKILFSPNVGSDDTNSKNVEVTEGTEDSRIAIDSQRTVTSQGVDTPVVNSENVPVSENTEISRNIAVPQCGVSEPVNAQTVNSPAAENIATMAELLAVEIKKEVDEDDDVTFVWASNDKVATSTEDKGIQADISTLFPLNADTNYLKAPALKRRKWKFLETTNSMKIPKISKTRTRGMQKVKAIRKSRNKIKGTLLGKQSDNQSLQEKLATLTSKDEQLRNTRLQNTKLKTKEIVKLSPTVSTKPCQTDWSQLSQASTIVSTKPCNTVNNILASVDSKIPKTSTATSTNQREFEKDAHSGDGYQMSKTSTITSTKPCKTIDSRISSDDSQISRTSTATSTNHCESENDAHSGDGYQMSKTSTITSTKPCKTIDSRLSSDDSQISRTSTATSTNHCESENDAHSGDGYQMSKTSTITSTKPCKTIDSRLSSDDSQISRTSTATCTNQCESDNNAHSGDDYQMSKNSTITSTKPCQTTTKKLSEVACQMSKTVSTSTKPSKITNNKLSGDSSQVSNKSFKTNSVNKRSSKRLMLKKSMKTYLNKDTESLCAYSKARNARGIEEASFESLNVKKSQPCAVASAVPELPTSHNVTNVNYTLRNSEIKRCFVRLSRIVENSKINNNQINDSKVSVDVKETKPLHKVCDMSEPTSNLVQKTQEVPALGGTSSRTSDRPSSSFRYGSSTNEITNDSPQALQKTPSLSIASTHSFDITKCGNNSNRAGNAVEISENTSVYLPDTKKVTSAIQLPQRLSSPNKALPQTIDTPPETDRVSNDNQATDSGIEIPQKSPPENKLLQQILISPSYQVTNECVEIPQKSSGRMLPQTAKILPTGFKSHEDQTTNSAPETPQKSPSVPFAKKIFSSLSDTCRSNSVSNADKAINSGVQLPQKSSSLNKSSPRVVCHSSAIEENNNQTSNDFVQLPQKSLPVNEFSKQVSIPSTDTCRVGGNNGQNVHNSTDKLQQLPRLRGMSSEPINTTTNSGSRDNQAEKHLVQEPTKSAPSSELSKQAHRSSLDISKTVSSTTQFNNSLIRTPQNAPPTTIDDISSAKGANADYFTINNSVEMAALTELSKQTFHGTENNFKQNNNYSVLVLQQSSLADISPTTFKDESNTTRATSQSAQNSQQTSSLSRTSPQIIETPTVIQENSGNRVNNSFQVPQQSQPFSIISQQSFRSSPNTPKSANSDNRTIKNLTEIPQTSPSVIKTLKSSDVTNNAMPISKGSCSRASTIVNNSIETPQNSPSLTRTLLQGFNAYDTMQTPKDYLSRMFPRSSNTINYPVEMAQKSPSSTKTQNYNTHNSTQIPNDPLSRTLPPRSMSYSVQTPQKSPSLSKTSLQGSTTTINPVPISQTSPTSSRISPHISVHNSGKTLQNSPFLNRASPQDSGTSSASFRCINNEQAGIKSIHVPQKSPNTSNMLQPTFSAPTEFYRYSHNGQQVSNNSTPISCTRMSPQFANTSSAEHNSAQTPHKTAVGRTSYLISKTPPIAHRRASGNNKTTNNSGQILETSLLNATSSQVTSGLSDMYMYGNRNAECEIDLTTASKSSSREEIQRPVNKKDPTSPDSKVPKRNPSKYEDEDSLKSIPSDTVTNNYQPYTPFLVDTTPFRFYPPYRQKTNENRSHNEYAKKIQGNSTEHPPISFPTNQEMRQNSYSSSSSSSSQFSPDFRQPCMLNKLHTKTVNSKQATEAKKKDLDLRNPNAALREHVAYNSGPPLEQTNFCETQKSPSSATATAFTDPKDKYATLSKSIPESNLPGVSHKKLPKEDQNYLNRKPPDAHHFNGSLSPDYGYFSPLTKNAPPNFESVVYRPNPIHFNEANSFHNYRGIATASQHTPMDTRETYHHANAALPVPNNDSNSNGNSNNTYIRQNSKLPPNTATLPLANGVQHKVQQPDVDKISSILPKLQQSETLNPEQYVLEMSVLEKDGCPRPFLEFYTFVTKKQISSYQLPISFRIFLEFHNAGKLKNFENAFRVYSERHEKEKKLMLNST